jgi:DNA-binding NarL/FixJ family response regulator
MAENGFTYIRRSIQNSLWRLSNSPAAASIREKLTDKRYSDGKITIFNTEISRKLSELARQENMDTGPFVLNLINYALDAYGQEIEDMEIKIALWQQLTKREQEVAALACKGLTNPQIAEGLHISEETVKKHISNVLHKFQVKGRGILRWSLEGWNFDNSSTPWR